MDPDRDCIAALAQAGQRGAGRVGEPARRRDQFLDGRAMIALKQRNNTSQLQPREQTGLQDQAPSLLRVERPWRPD